MADRILKPDSGNDLVLQNDDGSGKIEINENASIPVTGTLDVSGATLTTSTAQKQAIVQAGPGSGTLDVSSGTFTTSSAQKQAIVQAGPGSGTLDVSSGTFTTSSAQKQAIVDGATIEAQDLASGSGTTLPNNVQDAITRLGTVTSGTFNGSIGSSATGFTGIKEADQFRITTNTTGAGTLTSNWERVDDSSFSRIGSGISEASGVFSFTQTGIYFIQAFAMFKSTSGAHDYAGLGIYIDQGSGYTLRAETFNGLHRSNAYCTQMCNCFFDVTDTTNDKVVFNRSVSNTADIILFGSTANNFNAFTFIRLGDT